MNKTTENCKNVLLQLDIMLYKIVNMRYLVKHCLAITRKYYRVSRNYEMTYMYKWHKLNYVVQRQNKSF